MTLSDMGPQNNMWCKTKHDVFFFLVISSECFPNDPFVWSRLAGGGGVGKILNVDFGFNLVLKFQASRLGKELRSYCQTCVEKEVPLQTIQ